MRDYGGWTPFAEAVNIAQFGQSQIVEFLLATGKAQVDVQSTESIEDETTGVR